MISLYGTVHRLVLFTDFWKGYLVGKCRWGDPSELLVRWEEPSEGRPREHPLAAGSTSATARSTLFPA